MSKDGGPAFPADRSLTGQPQGMSLRDYFAGQALMASPEAMRAMGAGGVSVDMFPAVAAKAAYEYADAMLEERERKR